MLSDFIRIYDNAITTELCDELISIFESSDKVVQIDTKDDPHSGAIRLCSELNVFQEEEEMNPFQPIFSGLTELAAMKYATDLKGGFIFPSQMGCEQFRMNKFIGHVNPPQQFTFHVAVNDYTSAHRFVAMMWFLNDVAEGGEITMPQLDFKVSPKKGRLLVFPATWMFPYQEEPAVDNKYVLSTFLHYI